jgi:hypothetical protein
VRQGPAREEKATRVELTEGGEMMAIALKMVAAATLRLLEVNYRRGSLKAKAVAWFLRKKECGEWKMKGWGTAMTGAL